jgi:hypothetical protein
MSLRKSPTLTAARLEANRRSAKNSTGPRTAPGKLQSSLNSLRTGNRSRLMHTFYLTLFNAPPGAVDRVTRAILTPELAALPLFAETVDLFRWAENSLMRDQREIHARAESRESLANSCAGKPPAQEFLDFLRGLGPGGIACGRSQNRGGRRKSRHGRSAKKNIK